MFPDINFKFLGEGYFPITTASLVWFVVAEVTRTVNNVRRYEGNDSTIPGIILLFLRKVHAIDDDRARQVGLEPHASRLIDQLTPEQIAAIMAGRVPAGLPPLPTGVPKEPIKEPDQ
jgi:hypothetical protein